MVQAHGKGDNPLTKLYILAAESFQFTLVFCLLSFGARSKFFIFCCFCVVMLSSKIN